MHSLSQVTHSASLNEQNEHSQCRLLTTELNSKLTSDSGLFLFSVFTLLIHVPIISYGLGLRLTLITFMSVCRLSVCDSV